MDLVLDPNEERLYSLLVQKLPDLITAEALLAQGTYTVEEISKVGLAYIWACVEECWEHFREGGVRSEEVVHELFSAHVCQVLTLLLRFGADPNRLFENDNIMFALRFLDNGYLAADALILLLEHGGDLGLVCDGSTFFEDVDLDVFFDAVEQEDRQRYASLVHFWMVCLAFGGTLSDGKAPVELRPGFAVEELKDHRRFYFGITKGVSGPDIHIFDKADQWEVAWA